MKGTAMHFGDTLTSIVRSDLDQGITPALMGEPAIGKSSFVEGLAHAMDTRAFVLPCNQLAAKEDLTGARLVKYTRDDGTESYRQDFFPHQVVTEAVDFATAHPRQTVILFLDEINRAGSDITSAVLTLVTLRRLGRVDLPDNLRIIVAGNDKGNVTTLDDASISRFSIYHVEPDAATFITIMGDRLNPWIRTVLSAHPDLIFCRPVPASLAVDGDDDPGTATAADLWDAGDEMAQFTAPRTLEGLSRWLNRTSRSEVGQYLADETTLGSRRSNVLSEIIEAHIGNTRFAELLVAEIATDLVANPQGSTASVTVPRPACYDQLEQATSMTGLETVIGGLTGSERASSLIYTLSVHTDASRLIEALSPVVETTDITSDHLNTIVDMGRARILDQANTRAVMDSRTPVAGHLNQILSMFI
ncbi:MAG: AAA family ATPase [Cutibacterium avidum]|nr:AAA family ATPase [Cutibacterium avidum]